MKVEQRLQATPAQINTTQWLLQKKLSENRDVIFKSRCARGYDFVAVTLEPDVGEHWILFKTKDQMLNFLQDKTFFAYDSRNSNQAILMF